MKTARLWSLEVHQLISTIKAHTIDVFIVSRYIFTYAEIHFKSYKEIYISMHVIDVFY